MPIPSDQLMGMTFEENLAYHRRLLAVTKVVAVFCKINNIDSPDAGVGVMEVIDLAAKKGYRILSSHVDGNIRFVIFNKLHEPNSWPEDDDCLFEVEGISYFHAALEFAAKIVQLLTKEGGFNFTHKLPKTYSKK